MSKIHRKETSPERNTMVVVPAEPVLPKRHRLLRKALWVNTWLLLSLAIASKQVSSAIAASPLAEASPVGIAPSATPTTEQEDDCEQFEQESHELEVSEDRDIEEYRAYETSSSWVNEHLSSSKWSGEESGGIIVVATVDGSIAGLDRQTGKVKWKQQGVSLVESDLPSSTSSEDESTSNHSKVLSPLVSTTTTTKSSRHDWRTAAVPSVDGRVFLTASGSSEMTASSTLKELVARAPFVDARGRFYVGTRQATAAALDKSTGEILRVVSGDASPEPLAMEGRQVIWVGRVDYSISLFDARSGVMDVKFSASEVMGVQDMVVDSSVENEDGTMNLAAAPRLMLPTGMGEMNGDDRDKQLSMLVATPSGNVALRNPITGAIEWVSNEIFDAPVVFALEASTGMSLGVDILPDAPKPSTSFEYLAPQLERQIEVISSSQESSDQTIVGALSSGQLFAMPLGKRLSKQRSAAQQQHVGLPHHSLPTSSVIGSMPIGSSKVPNLISGRRSKPVSTDPDHQHSTLAKKSCGPTSPNFPACLVGGIHRNNDFLSGDSSFLDGSGNQREIALSRYPYGYPNSDDSGSAAVMNKRSFFKLMESWLPPTMALIFVLSFEMGRRLKAKRTKEEDNSMPLQTMLENHSSAVRNVGVITVTDQVLGFGGHGTVVYRGTLDGRQVAVKRMLKAYHASADREISLLIESDGHPNVVRYFLKEVHGDFVYLALELCDMSLHDLIGTLRQHSSPLQQPALSIVTKTTLHQVACGVRHLHSLRIVHRDLKPANILLALKARNMRKEKNSQEADKKFDEGEVFIHFEKGDYVAKISDMGLGKQLTGQSSFGLSTLGNASIQLGPAGGESSRLTGGGPGSVGWQAPEVMAIRWSSETPSVKSDSSSFMDASPLDANTCTRTSRSVDVFSLGCIFHCTLIPGVHPFGDWYEREANIMRNKPATDDLLKLSPDAHDLVTSMIARDPNARPTANEVCDHPFFWVAQKKLAFLCEVSDRIELDCQALEDGREPTSMFGANTFAIERNAISVVGTAWDQDLDPDLISNVSKFRTYDPSSVRDCLRLIRNKHHHYDELPLKVKQKVGSNPDGLLHYFEALFPRLLMHCYHLCRDYMDASDAMVLKYSITCPRNQTAKAGPTSSHEERAVSAVAKAVAQPVMSQVHDELSEVKELTNLVDENMPVEPSENTISPSNSIAAIEVGVGAIYPSSMSNNDEQNAREVMQVLSSLEDCDIVVWEGSAAAKTFNCRGWLRADDEWTRRFDASAKKIDSNLTRCSTDSKFRTRLCNHWDVSHGTYCPMRKKGKCVFAHGPVELRVKEGKKNRWGKLVDKNGNNSNPRHSGGEDTYGIARTIESTRKEEGKWNTERQPSSSSRPKQNGNPDSS